MGQEISNENSNIDKQVNIAHNTGHIFTTPTTRLSKRFLKLKEEVQADTRYNGVMDELNRYLTKLDGVETEVKLRDGGFGDKEITRAIERKMEYSKKLEKGRYFLSAQWINSQLLAKIKIDFEEKVERPLISTEASKEEILDAVLHHVVEPMLDLLNVEGEHDEFLNYNAEDVYGMIYYLTGKCHLNWKDYDRVQ